MKAFEALGVRALLEGWLRGFGAEDSA